MSRCYFQRERLSPLSDDCIGVADRDLLALRLTEPFGEPDRLVDAVLVHIVLRQENDPLAVRECRLQFDGDRAEAVLLDAKRRLGRKERRLEFIYQRRHGLLEFLDELALLIGGFAGFVLVLFPEPANCVNSHIWLPGSGRRPIFTILGHVSLS